jgi:hypothetical protein
LEAIMMMWWWQLWPWPVGPLTIIAAMILGAVMTFLMIHVIEMMDHRQHPDPQPPEPSG